jgi:hypothetical protein
MSGTVSTAFALLALATLAAVLVVARLASRRNRRHDGELVVERVPQGRRHVAAAHVGTVSSFGMGLHLPPPRQSWRKSGSLLTVR